MHLWENVSLVVMLSSFGRQARLESWSFASSLIFSVSGDIGNFMGNVDLGRRLCRRLTLEPASSFPLSNLAFVGTMLLLARHLTFINPSFEKNAGTESDCRVHVEFS